MKGLINMLFDYYEDEYNMYEILDMLWNAEIYINNDYIDITFDNGTSDHLKIDLTGSFKLINRY